MARKSKNQKPFVNLKKNSDLEKWQNDAYINDLIRKAADGDQDAYDEFARCVLAGCNSYASGYKSKVEGYAHIGNEVDDFAMEMACAIYAAFDQALAADNPKRYLITAAKNSATKFENKESTTLGFFAKANDNNRDYLKKAVAGEKVETGDAMGNFIYNQVAANSKSFVSTDDTVKTENNDSMGCATIGDTIADDNALDPFDMIEAENAAENLMREMADPVMRIIVSTVSKQDPNRSGYNQRIRERMALDYLKEEYGIDEDLFKDSCMRGNRIKEFYRDLHGFDKQV